MRIAIYAGTFDPITRGHLSVVERAAGLFDRLIVVVAVNPSKEPLFSVNEREGMIREVTRPWSNVECTSTHELVVSLARSRGAKYLVRGVRGATDIEAEIALARGNREIAPEVETVFVPAHAELSEVSSSRLKALAADGLDISVYCPPEVEARLRRRIAEQATQGGARV
jgi:pantetheine-phosphate adenylyltransferase